MDKFREQEILFEHKDCQWRRFDEDPDDPEYEIERLVQPAYVYKEIANLKRKGWQVREVDDPSFDGILLYKEVRIDDPVFDNDEIVFEYVNAQWYMFEKNPEDDISVVKRRLLSPRQAEKQINHFKKQGWKVKDNSSFSGVILYKLEDDEDEEE